MHFGIYDVRVPCGPLLSARSSIRATRGRTAESVGRVRWISACTPRRSAVALFVRKALELCPELVEIHDETYAARDGGDLTSGRRHNPDVFPAVA